MTNTLSPTESQIQMSFCDYVAKVRPDLRDAIIKIKNEGKLSWQKGKQNKKRDCVRGRSIYSLQYPTQNTNSMACGWSLRHSRAE